MPRVPVWIGLPCCFGLMILFAVVGAGFAAAFWGFLTGAYLVTWATGN